MLSIAYPMDYTTFVQWVAAMSPNPAIAAQLFGFVTTLEVMSFFVLSLHGHDLTSDDRNGVLKPCQHPGLWKWKFRVSPYIYVIEGLIQGKSALPLLRTYFCIDSIRHSGTLHSEITCAPIKYITA